MAGFADVEIGLRIIVEIIGIFYLMYKLASEYKEGKCCG
jgi:hypothetical protein